MVKKSLILDPAEYDTNNVIATIEDIRRHNLQRFEMEQLTAICYEDPNFTGRRLVLSPGLYGHLDLVSYGSFGDKISWYL